MNISISSCSSHVVNSINSSLVCKLKSEKELEPLRSFRSIDSKNIEIQLSARSKDSNLVPSGRKQGSLNESTQLVQVIYTNRSSTPEPPKRKKPKRARRRLTLPPPRIIETNETSKASELRNDNYQLLKNTKKFFECFEYKRGCLSRVTCRKITLIEKLKQLKNREIEQKYTKRSFKRVMNMKNDFKMSYDRHINIIDLNILSVLIKDGADEFENFLNTLGLRVLYLQIFGVSERVLMNFKQVVINSKVFETSHPVEFLVRIVAGYFLRHFKLIHGKYNFYEPRYLNKLLTVPDEFFSVVEIN